MPQSCAGDRQKSALTQRRKGPALLRAALTANNASRAPKTRLDSFFRKNPADRMKSDKFIDLKKEAANPDPL
jgi:hypothetical protein